MLQILHFHREHAVGLEHDVVRARDVFAGDAHGVDFKAAAARDVENLDRFAFFKSGREQNHDLGRGSGHREARGSRAGKRGSTHDELLHV